ncbi:hypothetical protein BJ165DRAFT_1190906 [Panaeolus papilionaceus]|nr:hypothetical protein BJ165DRAFT_1190906 [Panaeolus papilionaceus]
MSDRATDHFTDRNGKSKVIPEDVEKRRALFWELLYLDARLSLSAGRPPSLSVNYMDVQRPSYVPDEGCHPLENQEWKHTCYVKCLAPVLDAISRPSIDYETVLDLDKGIRDLPIPPTLRSTERTTKALALQRASVSTSLEAVLLQLHRQFFTKALSGPEEPFNRRHKYAPSVVAVFLSASRMIATVQELYTHEGPLAARILGYLSNAFSAAVALCLLVSRAPFTCLSPAALQELERARQLFKAARETSPRADQAFPVLEAMIDKTNDIYNRWSNGQEIPTIVLRHITDDVTFEGNLQDTPPYSPYQQPQQLQPDSFARSHRSLAQCIVEVHERAKALFPLRKPCQCSAGVAKPCPPSHLWSPPPSITVQCPPVLPRDAPTVIPFPSSARVSPTPHQGFCSPSAGSPPTTYSSPGQTSSQLPVHYGIYQQRVLPANGHAIPHFPAPSNSKLSMETINFELGALTSNPGQGLLEFF